MKNRNRFIYQPGLPLGKNGKRVTGGTEHIALSREAAAEGMVLLKNEKQVLPLAKGTKAAVFGKACVDYVKGGGGSGDVTVAYVRNLLDALRKKEAEGKVSIYEPLGAFYEKEVAKQYEAGIVPGMTSEPQIPEELLKAHPEDCVRIPMRSEVRSLNLSNSVAIGVYEALRQWGYPDLSVKGSLHRLHWDEEDAT